MKKYIKYLFILGFILNSTANADIIADPIIHKDNIEVVSWSNKINSRYYINEELELYVKCSKDCYVNIIDHATSGKKLNKIFPNKKDKDNFIRKGEVMKIPRNNSYAIKIHPPSGENLIKIVVSTENITPEDIITKDLTIKNRPNVKINIYEKIIYIESFKEIAK